MAKSSGTDEVALLLLNQVSLPAARRDYELRSSSPAPRATAVPSPATSSSQLVSRAFQNARAMSFNAASTALHKDVVPFVLHPAPNQRVFFSGPLTSSGGHGMPMPMPASSPSPHAAAAAAGAIVVRPDVVLDDNDQALVVSSSSPSTRIPVDAAAPAPPQAVQSQSARRIDRAVSGVLERTTTRIPAPPRRTQSGDLRASKASTVANNTNRTRSSELMRGSSWRPR